MIRKNFNSVLRHACVENEKKWKRESITGHIPFAINVLFYLTLYDLETSRDDESESDLLE